MNHLSLFTGIGGLDIAAEMAGFTTVGQCEWADYPTKVLEKHWPHVARWRDIRTLTGDDFYKRTGLQTVDIISGGFPCQPFSVAGKQRGKEDDRYLWPEMLRVISEIRPTWFIGENVAGLVSLAEPVGDFKVESRTINRFAGEDIYCAVLTRQERMLLVSILEDVEKVGYEVQPFIIPACGVDAPHRRDRVAIVGWNANRKHAGAIEGLQKWESTSAAGICGDVADTHDAGCKKLHFTFKPDRKGEPAGCSVTEDVDNSLCRGFVRNNGGRKSSESEDGYWWPAEPNVGRVAHGISNRVDRLKCLGNAVVPQQFYPIFHYISMILQVA